MLLSYLSFERENFDFVSPFPMSIIRWTFPEKGQQQWQAIKLDQCRSIALKLTMLEKIFMGIMYLIIHYTVLAGICHLTKLITQIVEAYFTGLSSILWSLFD